MAEEQGLSMQASKLTEIFKESALVVGTARNCAARLPGTLARLERLQSTFAGTKFVIVTNDNADQTKTILEDWVSRRPDAHVICLDGLAAQVTQRTARLAVARTAYLDVLREDIAGGRKHDLLVVADLDGLNSELIDEPEFSAALRTAPLNWSAVFANTRGPYYDVWALRHPTWCPDDCLERVRNAPKPLFGREAAKEAAVQKYIRSRQITVDPARAPIEVDSAFGGFGIYRTERLNGASYQGLNARPKRRASIARFCASASLVAKADYEVCEHVSFNKAIRRAGGHLYILPALLTNR